jgi:hypothetical protein
MSRCVFDYGGECQSAKYNRGATSRAKCKACEGYVAIRVSHNRELLRRLRAERRRLSAEIAILLHDIAESERC